MSLWTIFAVVVVVMLVAGGWTGKLGRPKIQDLEAKLRPVAGPDAATGAWGTAEREEYSDGEAEFEAFVRKLDLPDASVVEFVVAGVSLGRASVASGTARLEFRSAVGEDVPPVEIGQRIEVRHDGSTLLSGEFRPD